MRISKLTIHNIGIIEHEEIKIDKPLLIFYGQICQGKTTILSSVRWVCGGEFPEDILRHGTKDGHIELSFDGGMIRREFYKSKDGSIKARAIEFIRNGRPVPKPVEEIKRLLNPFTLDQDYLVRKSTGERNKYFIELFGVETADLDTAIFNLEREASAIRSELKGYGEIDLTPHKRVDTVALQRQRQEKIEAVNTARQDLESELESINRAQLERIRAVDSEREKVRTFNLQRQAKVDGSSELRDKIAGLKAELAKQEELLKTTETWLASNPPKDTPADVAPVDTSKLRQDIDKLRVADTTEIDQQIAEAGAANVRAEQYDKNVTRDKERQGKAEKLNSQEADLKKLREAKLERLTTINDTCKIPGLKFTDGGDFVYQETTASMLSTSQLLLLSKELSGLYPEGLGLQLIDRGESLGKSIFGLIDRAKKEEKTILATVVGERPAQAPDDVGVFVVEQGKIS